MGYRLGGGSSSLREPSHYSSASHVGSAFLLPRRRHGSSSLRKSRPCWSSRSGTTPSRRLKSSHGSRSSWHSLIPWSISHLAPYSVHPSPSLASVLSFPLY